MESTLMLSPREKANDYQLKQAAIDDPDLKPLWDSMSGTLWKCTEQDGSRTRKGLRDF
jgi:hypothetical protein